MLCTAVVSRLPMNAKNATNCNKCSNNNLHVNDTFQLYFQIPVVADLPVGQNLQDHVFNIAGHFTLEAPITITENKIMSFWSWLQYAVLGTGMRSLLSRP